MSKLNQQKLKIEGLRGSCRCQRARIAPTVRGLHGRAESIAFQAHLLRAGFQMVDWLRK